MATFTQRTPAELDAALNQALQRMPWANRAQLVNEALARYLKMPSAVRYVHTVPHRLVDLSALGLLAEDDVARLVRIAGEHGRHIAIVGQRREHASMVAAIMLNEYRSAESAPVRSMVLRDETAAYAEAPPLLDVPLATAGDEAVTQIARALAAQIQGDDEEKRRIVDLVIVDSAWSDRALHDREVHRVLRTARRVGMSSVWTVRAGIDERLLVNMHAIIRIDESGQCTVHGPDDRAGYLPARVRRICANVAREALPDLQRHVTEDWSRHVSWGVSLHAIGDFEVAQADVVGPVRYPSIFVVFDPGWSAEDLRVALERRWAVEFERMNDYPVDETDDEG
jgi:hypothetical protein